MELRIRALGALEAEIAGAAVRLPPGRRVRGLLAWLALHPGLHPRSRLAGWLWPDVPDDRARASLRSALWSLRGALGPAGCRHLIADRQSVGLRDVSVDVADFRRLADAGRLREAVELCRGELLYEFDADWAFEARTAHTEQLTHLLGRLSAAASAAGHDDEALAWARQRAALAPLDEEAGRDLISRLAEAGHVPASLTAYDSFRRRLRRELGIPPSASTRRLAARVRAGRAGAAQGLKKERCAD